MAKLENVVILALECYKLELTSKQEAVQSVVNHINENYIEREGLEKISNEGSKANDLLSKGDIVKNSLSNATLFIEKVLKNIEGENEDD